MTRKTRPKYLSSGFTLVELMIALVLGSLVILAVTQIYLSSAQTNRLQNEQAIMNSKSLFILDYMERSIREAGFASCSPAFLVGNWAVGGNLTNLLLAGNGIRGFEHSGTSQGNTFTLPGVRNFTSAPPAPVPANSLAGSDVLILQNRNTQQVTIAGPANSGGSGGSGGGNSGNNQGGGNVVVCPGGVVQSGTNIQIVENIAVPQDSLVFFEKACQGGDFFVKTNQSGQGQGNSGTTFTKGTNSNLNSSPAGFCNNYAAGETVTLSVIEQTAFYVAAGSNNEPALFVTRFNAVEQGVVTEEILGGVESMQLTYGVAGGGNSRSASNYVNANQVTDWSQVVSIRISLLLRSSDGVLPTATSRSLLVNDTTLQTPSDRRARMVVTATAAIRSKTL